jgi:hypothetical protein
MSGYIPPPNAHLDGYIYANITALRAEMQSLIAKEHEYVDAKVRFLSRRCPLCFHCPLRTLSGSPPGSPNPHGCRGRAHDFNKEKGRR